MRAETPEDKGTYGVATRRFTYMGYGGTKEYVQALRDIVVAIMIEKPGTVDTLEEVLSVKGVDMVQWEAPTTRWASDGPASATPRSYEW